jgi:hypothetical protein
MELPMMTAILRARGSLKAPGSNCTQVLASL